MNVFQGNGNFGRNRGTQVGFINVMSQFINQVGININMPINVLL